MVRACNLFMYGHTAFNLLFFCVFELIFTWYTTTFHCFVILKFFGSEPPLFSSRIRLRGTAENRLSMRNKKHIMYTHPMCRFYVKSSDSADAHGASQCLCHHRGRGGRGVPCDDTNTTKHHAQKLQNRAARIITNSSFDTPSRPLIAELGWQTIEELIGNESKTMVFKALNDLAPQYLCNLFTKNSACSSRNLRNTETDLRLPKKNSANGQKCFSFRGVKLWNSLPAESKTASSLNGFKKSIKG